MVKEITGERLSSTLRRLAEDVVTTRRRATQLTHENQSLRARLDALQGSVPTRQDRPVSAGPVQPDATRSA
jgi:hypothetical protein